MGVPRGRPGRVARCWTLGFARQDSAGFGMEPAGRADAGPVGLGTACADLWACGLGAVLARRADVRPGRFGAARDLWPG
ncbi:hypothetical protein [Dactylosporangium sp. CA-233914]|uniref:hypothetical protein n=1 Tax=Dactylosporangium sp. CA-233914 TaxID=3239934 RepID=UPI003D8C1BA7